MVAIACLMLLETGQHQEAPPPLVVLPQVVLVLQGIIGCLTAADGVCQTTQAGVEALPPILHPLLQPRPNRLRLQPQQSLLQLLHLPNLLPHQPLPHE